ncbi:hypothetical protein M3Y99_00919400 [Aphelenchoides fujianensis]|nr:hypothetical protein M3Y99_00919400 [Aphelenchoides fujianensis]
MNRRRLSRSDRRRASVIRPPLHRRRGEREYSITFWFVFVLSTFSIVYFFREPLGLSEVSFANYWTPKLFAVVIGLSAVVSSLIFGYEWIFGKKKGEDNDECVRIPHGRPRRR